MTGKFITPLRLEYVKPGEPERILTGPFAYESKVAGRIFIVPTGFRTDLASVPRLPLAYMLFGGVADEAAVIHDYLYSGVEKVSRKVADDVFAEAMETAGVAAWRRGPMWLGVRLFGGMHYEPRAAA